MASIYLPPIARKKKVEGWPRQDTTRVFSDFKEDKKQEATSYGSQFVRHNIPPTPQRALSPNRKNKPQPTSVTFLRQNPRFVCEPICHVDTPGSKAETFHSWWPNEILESPVVKPQYTLHSTSRADYKTSSHENSQVSSYSRYDTSVCKVFKPNYNFRDFPGCTSSQIIPNMSEKISYEHQFNSRLDPSHPIRGRRHGCFVLKATTPVHKTHHNKYPKPRKYEFEYMKNTETEDNCDTKSVISTVTEKSQVQEHSKYDNNKKSKMFEHKIKDNAWSEYNDQPLQATQEDIPTSLNLTESEVENMIKPSRPRHSPPPHVT
ncbi:uncharacterized protein C2orf73 [Exaiptasia diaphana]|uniref:Uncharacterized protein n=1 Tax=Exaiptasia diaphana TaxID=2652724 RepID=A0A913XZM7_EXADI|nr:uncharacterized protein C2orf73 [Exaiptasia diaphana]KXJ07761.1 Uncharacterized protein C2orf73 [Exaiptasia diaphana]